MQLIRDIKRLGTIPSRCVATIGNFDGVHKGHQALLSCLVAKAQTLQRSSVLILFEPQPQERFCSTDVAARLTGWREKWESIVHYAIDYMVCLRFNCQLAQCSAVDFVRKILIEGLRIGCLVIGKDFHFGYQRHGDLSLLRQLGEDCGFSVDTLATVSIDGQRICSSRVRRVIADGDFALAKRLLGRPFSLSGRVGFGTQRGRQLLGFPTANIALKRKVIPLTGVFIVQVHGLGQIPRPGVANLGWRPSFSGTEPLLEAHLLDFEEMIYGRRLQIEFLAKLRAEQKFTDFSALKGQIEQDVTEARLFFGHSIPYRAAL